MAWYMRLFHTVFRFIFILLDWVVYTCIRVFYNLFEAIASIRIFDPGQESNFLTEVSDRVYILIGVYALFKVVFVLINMMINPSDGSKGEKSVGKLATRIFVMLALIIITPFVFNYAYEFQEAVLSENVIGQLVLGEDMPTANNGEDMGQSISNEIFSSFVSPSKKALVNPDQPLQDLSELSPDTVLNSDAKDACSDSFESLKTLYQQSNSGVNTNDGVSSMFYAVTNVFKDSDSGKDEFCIDYTYLISTIAGGFAAFAFAVYCIDIGLRVAKLAFFQLIAPVPIVSYVDGKKDGPFYKWMKQTISTYLDVFIRLLIIYFIILLIKDGVPEIMQMEVITKHDIVTQLLAKAFVILGLLMFAMQAPKLICDLLGIESTGALSLNPRKKLEKMPAPVSRGLSMAGGLAATGAGLAGGIIGGTAAGLIKGGPEGKGKAIKDNIVAQARGAGAEAAARLQGSNYNDKGKFNGSVNRRNLASQALHNRDAGIGGRLAGAMQSNINKLSYMTPEREKTPGLKAAKVAAINAGYKVQNMENAFDQIKKRIENGLANPQEQLINVDGNFKNKGAYESFLMASGITDMDTFDINYQANVVGSDGVSRNYYQNVYDDSGNVIRATTAAERLEIDRYAKSVADKAVEHEQKLMNEGKK